MATPTPVLAVLDADVLHPPGLRDLLLTVAEQGLYRPVWTARILTEMSESISEAAARRRLAEPDTARVEAEMRTAFPEAELSARSYDRLVAAMTNHPKDRHVLAAAVAANAAIIVSDDRKGFPRAACEPRGVRRLSAEAFLLELLGGHEERFIVALELMAGARRRPPNTVPAIIEALTERRPNLAGALRSAFERTGG